MPNLDLPSVTVTAAGEGSRIREYMTQALGMPGDYPKHLLPTGAPDDETLIGRIIRQASTDGFAEAPVINTTPTTMEYMMRHSDVGEVTYDTERFVFSMDPLYYRLRRTGRRVLGCAGDFYSDFEWSDFVEKHEKSGAAMSLLVNRTTTPVMAAVFDIDSQSGRVVGLRRPDRSPEGAVTNVGAYVIDANQDVLDVMDRYLPRHPQDAHADDTVFSHLMEAGLVGAIEIGQNHYNINTAQEYEALCSFTGSLSIAAASHGE